jgi:hypothetical protein
MIGLEHIAGWVRRRGRQRRFNPYIAGQPVFDRRLRVGRAELTERALALLDETSLALTGERRLGKTSFLHHLRDALGGTSGRTRSFPVFVDLEGLPPQAFFHALIDSAVEALVPLANGLGALRCNAVAQHYGADDFDHDVRVILADLRERMAVPVRIVFLVDEVDGLRARRNGAFGQYIGPLVSKRTSELRAVLAGTCGCEAVTELPLTRLTLRESEELVTRPVADRYSYEASAVDRIVDIACGRPYLIQWLCLHAVDRMLDAGRTTIRREDVDSVAGLERVLARVQPE